MMTLGQSIKKLKYISELSNEEIGIIVGCSHVTVSRLRRDLQDPTAKLLYRLVKLMNKHGVNVKVEDFMKD